VTDAAVERAGGEVLGERWRAAWCEGGFDRCATPDVRYEDPVAVEPLDGLEALEGHAARLRVAFPDLRLEPSAVPVANEGFACLPWRAAGTHAGPLGSFPPTDRFLTLHGVHYVEILHGEVRRARGFFDLHDITVQLGLAPGRGSFGESAVLMLRGFGLRARR
jgi:predicted ester cyclase